MAVLYIAEYTDLGSSGSGHANQIAALPVNAEQTVSISGSSAACTNAFKNNTRIVRLHTDAICSIEFGTAPTATTSTARMAANQTEYYQVPVGDAYKVAVISNT